MKKVKIVFTQSIGYDDYYGEEIIRDSLTDWEELSDEDFKLLKSNLHLIAKNKLGHEYSPRIIVQDEHPIQYRLESIKKALAELAEKKRIADEQREAKKKIAAEKKRQKEIEKLKKASDSERELFLQLKEKFGNEI